MHILFSKSKSGYCGSGSRRGKTRIFGRSVIMDIGSTMNNGQSNEGSPLAALPLGFGMALAMNEKAMQAYSGLSESQKEHIIMKCKDARSKAEMRKIVDSLVPDGNANSLFEEPKAT